ncbi:MAG: IS21 family transposase [Acidobacteriota bacterium]|nr:IS21 family transposase [Acidobacteriota bacterium]
MTFINKKKNLVIAATKAGMDEKTARKYRKLGKLPSQIKKEHAWRTRKDPFEEIWPELCQYLNINPGLEAKTLFEFLQKNNSGRFQDGQLRTLQRKVKVWRATEGPPREVFFPQRHHPGKLCQSDFTHLSKLGISIGRKSFPHLIYHFCLTYSNWETGSICFSESYQALSEGLQDALWKLGGVPEMHRTDRLSAAVHQDLNPEKFTARYRGLLRHYGMRPTSIQAGKANENGDIEQRHYRFKKALDQSLMLRGSRNFNNREEYEKFLGKLFSQLNAGRQKRFQEEMAKLKSLPRYRLDDCQKKVVRVGPASTIRILHNTYSVNSRLIGEMVKVRVYVQHLEVWYGQKHVDTLPRIRGKGEYRINYRHIIDWLVRKPGAFEEYRYREDLYPSTNFRVAYDVLKKDNPNTANKKYLQILHLAAKQSEVGVEQALKLLLNERRLISADTVRELLETENKIKAIPEIQMPDIDLEAYDRFLQTQEVL